MTPEAQVKPEGRMKMAGNQALMDRMIADRAARNRRTAFWTQRTAEMRAQTQRSAANDTTTPARTGS